MISGMGLHLSWLIDAAYFETLLGRPLFVSRIQFWASLRGWPFNLGIFPFSGIFAVHHGE